MKKLTLEEVIQKFRVTHSDRYNYDKVVYTGMKEYITIICPIHGEFRQQAKNHYLGRGCPSCGFESRNRVRQLSQEEFLSRAVKIHDSKYDYSKFICNGWKVKGIITCPIHGEFEQPPMCHLKGSGCQKCKSSKGEIVITKWLELNGIEYISQHRIDGCEGKRRLPFDFYLPRYNIAIEYQGIQHFEIVTAFGGESKFAILKKHDLIKREFCLSRHITLIEIRYDEDPIKRLNEMLSSAPNPR